jgi:hypothetical protein
MKRNRDKTFDLEIRSSILHFNDGRQNIRHSSLCHLGIASAPESEFERTPATISPAGNDRLQAVAIA